MGLEKKIFSNPQNICAQNPSVHTNKMEKSLIYYIFCLYLQMNSEKPKTKEKKNDIY